jgi:hypothetical protein
MLYHQFDLVAVKYHNPKIYLFCDSRGYVTQITLIDSKPMISDYDRNYLTNDFVLTCSGHYRKRSTYFNLCASINRNRKMNQRISDRKTSLKTKIVRCKKTVENLFSDFSDHSTIHGVNFVAEKGRSWFEKVWWIAAFCVSVLCCVKLIVDAWNINPIIISFTEKPTSIWQVSIELEDYLVQFSIKNNFRFHSLL